MHENGTNLERKKKWFQLEYELFLKKVYFLNSIYPLIMEVVLSGQNKILKKKKKLVTHKGEIKSHFTSFTPVRVTTNHKLEIQKIQEKGKTGNTN